MLAYANAAIDAVQNIKSQAISTIVKDETFATPLQSFVDAQTSFAKTATKSVYEFVDAVSKFDYASLAKVSK
jgi:hypothetical protein